MPKGVELKRNQLRRWHIVPSTYHMQFKAIENWLLARRADARRRRCGVQHCVSSFTAACCGRSPPAAPTRAARRLYESPLKILVARRLLAAPIVAFANCQLTRRRCARLALHLQLVVVVVAQPLPPRPQATAIVSLCRPACGRRRAAAVKPAKSARIHLGTSRGDSAPSATAAARTATSASNAHAT